MRTIINISFAFVLMLIPKLTLGQGFVQCGGQLVFDNGGHLVIDGTGNYYDTLNGEIKVIGSGNIWLPGDWSNASNGPVFSTNDGLVTLNGGLQNIKGSSRTSFPTLTLAGSADKSLNVGALVGGGFNGGGTGRLNCGSLQLLLNSNTLTINNPLNSAITNVGGGIVSESDGSAGYGIVEWVIRNNAGTYTVPFNTTLGRGVPYLFNATSAGTSTNDSGYVTIATYPTITNAPINNRSLPIGVTNSNNEFNRENCTKLIDRFWIMESKGFNTGPQGTSTFGYRDNEWDLTASSTNQITERNLQPIQFSLGLGSWDYSRSGTTNVGLNRTTRAMGSFNGIWTLADTTICPEALFIWDGNCEKTPIRFTDNSSISLATIESWDWDFGDGYQSVLQNTLHMYPDAGVYPVRFIVTASTGCPDTIIIPLTIDAKAIADFNYDDDPLVDIPVKFTSLSQNATLWDWDFGDFNSDNIENPSHTYQAEASYDVTLVANNLANCPDTITKTLEVNLPSLFLFPTAFSPGSTDNLNADFGLTTLQRVSEFRMTIYNRWGEQIFHSDDITKRWDGTYLGKPAPTGSYLYVVWFRDRTMKGHGVNGSVLLLR
jgi:gliding motility-associated-like protein